MHKNFLRTAALLLALCMVIDPMTAQAFAPSPRPVAPVSSRILELDSFTRQAMMLKIIDIRTRSLLSSVKTPPTFRSFNRERRRDRREVSRFRGLIQKAVAAISMVLIPAIASASNHTIKILSGPSVTIADKVIEKFGDVAVARIPYTVEALNNNNLTQIGTDVGNKLLGHAISWKEVVANNPGVIKHFDAHGNPILQPGMKLVFPGHDMIFARAGPTELLKQVAPSVQPHHFNFLHNIHLPSVVTHNIQTLLVMAFIGVLISASVYMAFFIARKSRESRLRKRADNLRRTELDQALSALEQRVHFMQEMVSGQVKQSITSDELYDARKQFDAIGEHVRSINGFNDRYEHLRAHLTALEEAAVYEKLTILHEHLQILPRVENLVARLGPLESATPEHVKDLQAESNALMAAYSRSPIRLPYVVAQFEQINDFLYRARKRLYIESSERSSVQSGLSMTLALDSDSAATVIQPSSRSEHAERDSIRMFAVDDADYLNRLADLHDRLGQLKNVTLENLSSLEADYNELAKSQRVYSHIPEVIEALGEIHSFLIQARQRLLLQPISYRVAIDDLATVSYVDDAFNDVFRQRLVTTPPSLMRISSINHGRTATPLHPTDTQADWNVFTAAFASALAKTRLAAFETWVAHLLTLDSGVPVPTRSGFGSPDEALMGHELYTSVNQNRIEGPATSSDYESPIGTMAADPLETLEDILLPAFLRPGSMVPFENRPTVERVSSQTPSLPDDHIPAFMRPNAASSVGVPSEMTPRIFLEEHLTPFSQGVTELANREQPLTPLHADFILLVQLAHTTGVIRNGMVRSQLKTLGERLSISLDSIPAAATSTADANPSAGSAASPGTTPASPSSASGEVAPQGSGSESKSKELAPGEATFLRDIEILELRLKRNGLGDYTVLRNGLTALLNQEFAGSETYQTSETLRERVSLLITGIARASETTHLGYLNTLHREILNAASKKKPSISDIRRFEKLGEEWSHIQTWEALHHHASLQGEAIRAMHVKIAGLLGVAYTDQDSDPPRTPPSQGPKGSGVSDQTTAGSPGQRHTPAAAAAQPIKQSVTSPVTSTMQTGRPSFADNNEHEQLTPWQRIRDRADRLLTRTLSTGQLEAEALRTQQMNSLSQQLKSLKSHLDATLKASGGKLSPEQYAAYKAITKRLATEFHKATQLSVSANGGVTYHRILELTDIALDKMTVADRTRAGNLGESAIAGTVNEIMESIVPAEPAVVTDPTTTNKPKQEWWQLNWSAARSFFTFSLIVAAFVEAASLLTSSTVLAAGQHADKVATAAASANAWVVYFHSLNPVFQVVGIIFGAVVGIALFFIASQPLWFVLNRGEKSDESQAGEYLDKGGLIVFGGWSVLLLILGVYVSHKSDLTKNSTPIPLTTEELKAAAAPEPADRTLLVKKRGPIEVSQVYTNPDLLKPTPKHPTAKAVTPAPTEKIEEAVEKPGKSPEELATSIESLSQVYPVAEDVPIAGASVKRPDSAQPQKVSKAKTKKTNIVKLHSVDPMSMIVTNHIFLRMFSHYPPALLWLATAIGAGILYFVTRYTLRKYFLPFAPRFARLRLEAA